MADFCIQVIKNKVKTARIIDGGLEFIRFSGEEWIEDSGYWDKFKSKIEYVEDEQLAFVIVSDTNSFALDSDIVISDKFTNNERDITWIIDGFDSVNYHIALYPETALSPTIAESINVAVVENKKAQSVEEDQVIAEQEVEVPNGNSLQSYYRKATRDLKRGSQ